MAPLIGIGNYIGSQSGGAWTQARIDASCLFYASDPTDILNKVLATHLPNQVTGAVDYFTVTGSGLNARYRTPDNDTYRTADSDYVFWKTDASESTCDGNRLIAYDFPRVLVKYLNASPYTILAIAILKPGVTVTDGMRDFFNLSIWWDGVPNIHGNLKGNRGAAKSTWVHEEVYLAETLALVAGFTTPATTGLKDAIDTLIKGLKTPGYWDRIDCLEKYNALAIDQIWFNWKTATSIASRSTANMAFVAKTGLKGTAVSDGYILTGWIPSNGVQYTQNAASMIIGRYNAIATSFWDGTIDGGSKAFLVRGDGNYTNINGTSVASGLGQLISGYHMVIRTSSTKIRVYNNGTWTELTNTSTGRSTKEMYLNAYNNNGSPLNISYSGYNTYLAGDKFSDVEAGAIRTLLIAYDTAISAL